MLQAALMIATAATLFLYLARRKSRKARNLGQNGF